MGSIYKPDDDRTKNWYIVYRNADGKLVRRSARTKDADKARAKLAELEPEVGLEKMARGRPSARIGVHRPLPGPLDKRVDALERTVSQLVDLHLAEADLLEEMDVPDRRVRGRGRALRNSSARP